MLLLNSYMETRIYEDEESKYVRFVYTSRQEMEKTFRLFTLGMNEKHGRMTNITTTIPVAYSFSWNIWSYSGEHSL